LVLLQVAISVVSSFTSVLVLKAFGHTVPFARLFIVVQASLTGNYLVPGRLGIPARAYLQREMLGVPLSVSAASMAVETLMGLGVSVLLASVGAVVIFANASALGATLVGVLSSLALWAIIRRSSIGADAPVTEGSQGGSRLRRFARASLFALTTARRGVLAAACLPFALSLAVGVWRAYVLALGMGYAPPVVPFVGALSLAYGAGQLSFLPMGLGAKDVSLAALLKKLGLTTSASVGFAAIDRVTGTGAVLFLGAMAALALVGMRGAKSRVPGFGDKTAPRADVSGALEPEGVQEDP